MGIDPYTLYTPSVLPYRQYSGSSNSTEYIRRTEHHEVGKQGSRAFFISADTATIEYFLFYTLQANSLSHECQAIVIR